MLSDLARRPTSAARHDVTKHVVQRTADGRRVCRGCRVNPVAPPRRTFCSDWCVDLFKIRDGGPRARWWVEQRDQGVCAGCGTDTEGLRRAYGALAAMVVHEAPPPTDGPAAPTPTRPDGLYQVGPTEHLARMRDAEALLAAAGFTVRPHPERACQTVCLWEQLPHLWEADHIVPVVEGGGGCDLSNLRTLCVPCHRVETGRLARRRARRRRVQRTFPFGDAP